MNRILKAIKICFYRYMGRTEYGILMDLRDRYSCGRTLAAYINPDILKHEKALNYWVDKIKKEHPKGLPQ